MASKILYFLYLFYLLHLASSLSINKNNKIIPIQDGTLNEPVLTGIDDIKLFLENLEKQNGRNSSHLSEKSNISKTGTRNSKTFPVQQPSATFTLQMPGLNMPGVPQQPLQRPTTIGQAIGSFIASNPITNLTNSITCPPTSSVCAPAGQCLLAGGVSIGNCAMGLFVCCTRRSLIEQTCTASNSLISIKESSGIIVSNPTAKSCRYEIYKANENICQIQLEFDTFNMDEPLRGEDCSQDSILTISESVTVKKNFPLCGNHPNTKMYLAFGRSSRISLFFKTKSNNEYNVRMKQIECKSPERVPDQCLQNLEGDKGLVTSFGFPNYMINGQEYTVCVDSKSVADFGRIEWQECEDSITGIAHNFVLSEYFMNLNETTTHLANFLRMPQIELPRRVLLPSEGPACKRTSYVEINGAEQHCGAKFLPDNLILTSESKPYMLSVNFKRDISENLPDFVSYRIPGLLRNASQDHNSLTEPPPENECEVYGETGGRKEKLSSQGYKECEILTKKLKGKVLYDFCMCQKKEGLELPEVPKDPEMFNSIKRRGFCLSYSVI